jgi:3-deoxy-D-manno-octulosonic-acid transferase
VTCERSFHGYHRIRRLLRTTLDRIDCIAVQTAEYAEHFRRLGAPSDRVIVTGSLKFDGATGDRHNSRTQKLRELAGIASDDIVFLAGSTQDPEERLAIESYQSLRAEFPNLRLIIVPRHTHRFDEVAALLDRSELAWTRRSKLGEVRNAECGMRNGQGRTAPASSQSQPPIRNPQSAIRNPQSTIRNRMSRARARDRARLEPPR